MTVPVQRATTYRIIRQTGRASAKVPMTANTNSGIQDQGLPAHQIASPTAAAQTTGTSIVTTVRTQARPNPVATPDTHDFIAGSSYFSTRRGSTLHRAEPGIGQSGTEVGLAPPLRASSLIPRRSDPP